MLNHSSIVAGARSSGAKVAVFQHNCKLINARALIFLFLKIKIKIKIII
jgi:7-keto-8-aminopelargonate synthetase-like enzyme